MIKRLVACCLMLLFLATSIMATSAADASTLSLGLQRDEFKLMNAFVRPWYDSANFLGMTHVSLLAFKPDLSVAPCLAEKWDISPDGKSIKFYLVKNATWHDGKPVTADDVAFSFDYWKKNNLYAQGHWFESYLDSAEVIDEHTVELVFKEPVATTTLTSQIPGTYIVPKHVWEKVEKPKEYDGMDAMVGCGPFIFENYDKDAAVVYLTANHNYFAGKPSVEKIEWRYYRTLDSLLLALKKGEIDAKLDYYQPVPGVYAADLIKSGNINLGIVPDIGVPLHLVFGFKQYPTNVTNFRQAISYAIDYQALIDMIAAGYGEVPCEGYSSPVLPGFNPNLPKLEYNSTKAKELLNRSGFLDIDGDGLRESPDGSKLKIPITPNSKQQVVRAAEVISRQLADVGLDTYVESLSSDKVSEKAWTNRDYYMLVGWSTPAGNIGADTGATYYADLPGLYGTCKDPEIADLVNKSMYSKDLKEMTSARSAIQEYVARQKPIIALIWGDAIYPYRTDRWENWTLMSGYGPVNYWSWFSMKPMDARNKNI
ncbi:MAG: putative ABC transporter periplasmic-binding protein [Methanosaeta sp. PtaU1.Bin060]|nr:MAG: putative ABC transporter periplasmic-binding protein [Methanosaeta sp. PtaU1.Bin060]